jgi:hypothetical protein
MRGMMYARQECCLEKKGVTILARNILSAGVPAQGYLATGFGTAGLPNLAASIGMLG